MQTVLSKEVVGYGGYNSYVNKKGHPTNIQFNFERILSKTELYIHMVGIQIHLYGISSIQRMDITMNILVVSLLFL